MSACPNLCPSKMHDSAARQPTQKQQSKKIN